MTYQAFAAEDRHREALERLWAGNMSDRRIAAVRAKRWTWLYEDNPAGPAVTYVVEHVESSRIVGAASAFPRDLVVNGQPHRAGVLADFVTDKDHRVAGPAVMVQRAIVNAHRERGMDFLFGYPNKGAAPVFPRLRFKTVSESSLWVKPLRTAKKLATFLHPIVAHALAPFANSVLSLNDLRLAVSRTTRSTCTFDRLPDQAFDDLWDRSKKAFPICGVRTSAYLTWRYVCHTTERYQFFTLQSPNAVHGYVVFTVNNDRVFVADLFAEGGYHDIETLLLAFCRRMRRRGHESVCINYAGDDRFLPSLRALQFVRRVGARNVVAFVGKDRPESLRQTVYDGSTWFLHDGELDI